MRRALLLLVSLSLIHIFAPTALAAPSTDFRPDPRSVRRLRAGTPFSVAFSQGFDASESDGKRAWHWANRPEATLVLTNQEPA